jgi:hypothetical protein
MRMLICAALVAATALVGGCANTSKLTYLPDGSTGFAINCSGSDASSTWAQCYSKAGEACGSYGYKVVTKDVDNGAAGGGSIGNLFGANIKNRSMVIQCNK